VGLVGRGFPKHTFDKLELEGGFNLKKQIPKYAIGNALLLSTLLDNVTFTKSTPE